MRRGTAAQGQIDAWSSPTQVKLRVHEPADPVPVKVPVPEADAPLILPCLTKPMLASRTVKLPSASIVPALAPILMTFPVMLTTDSPTDCSPGVTGGQSPTAETWVVVNVPVVVRVV